MALLKKLLLASAITVSLITVSPATFAAGKIEKSTVAEVKVAIDETIALSEDVLAAVEAGEATQEEVLILMKKTKQASKRIESNPVDRLRSKGNQRMAKARSAFKKGEHEKAIVLIKEVVSIYKEVKVKYNSF